MDKQKSSIISNFLRKFRKFNLEDCIIKIVLPAHSSKKIPFNWEDNGKSTTISQREWYPVYQRLREKNLNFVIDKQNIKK